MREKIVYRHPKGRFEVVERSGKDIFGNADAVRMWPTPTQRDYKGSNSMTHILRPGQKNHMGQLANAVKMFPTPRANCGSGMSKHGDGGQDLQTAVGGQLNPTWVEWLMGFPIGWTDLNV